MTAEGKSTITGMNVVENCIIELHLDDLLVIRMTCDSDHSPDFQIDISNPSWRPRLVAACRLLLKLSGPAFFDAIHVFRLRGRNSKNEEIFAYERRISGLEITVNLDLVSRPNGMELIDGAATSPKRDAADVSVIAFYLPQFYPFPENDTWWGEGFTEWSNVVGAESQLPGHNMPILPADLGFYDLRVKDTRRRQGQLASQYGIDGFCYYFYWFSGRRLMDTVVDDILMSGCPDTPFCLCWANEPWSRRWDGTNDHADLLIDQKHDVKVDTTLFAELLPFFLDERYIKVDGSPLLLIYRLDILDDASALIAAWRQEAFRAGFPGLFVAAARTFGLTDDAAEMVDAIVDFPPHTSVSEEISNGLSVPSEFLGKIFDYRQVIVEAVTRKPATKMTFPGIMPRWDNTARKAERSHIFWNSSPNAFKIWASLCFEQARELPLGRRYMFVNSWNEWGEGAMLEPDRHYGRAYLEALRSARSGYVVSPSDITKFSLVSGLPLDGAERYLQSFSNEVKIISQIMTAQRSSSRDAFRMGLPDVLTIGSKTPIVGDGMMIFDHSTPEKHTNCITIRFGQAISLIGWMTLDKKPRPYKWDRVAYLMVTMRGSPNHVYHVPITNWHERNDINKHYKWNLEAGDCYFGFDLAVSTDILPLGTYQVDGVQAIENEVMSVPCYVTIRKTDQ